jgi:ParB-like chromosome segregation protein Spo0J
MKAEVKCAHARVVKLDTLEPYPDNHMIHTDAQVELLAKIIQAQGWRSPIVVSNQSGFIVKGHARLLAAQKLGLDEAPVDFQDYASEEAEIADRIADNRLSSLALVNGGILRDELLKLDAHNVDMDLTGYDAPSIELMFAKDGMPPPPAIVDEQTCATDNKCPKCGYIW